MITIRNYAVFIGLFLLAGTSTAQTVTSPTYPPPEAPPAWATPAAPPVWGTPQPGAPLQPAAPGAAPYSDDSYFVPVQPNGGFDYFDEEDPYSGGGGGYGGGGSTGPREVKDSFKLVTRPKEDACFAWGNSLLGPTQFKERSKCEFELDRKVEGGYSMIDDTYDRVELYKIKKVIKGELKDRSVAKKYNVKFDSLREALRDASKQGCVCQER